MAVAFALSGDATALLHFRDALRPDAKDTLHELEAQGLTCSIVSGDSAAAVKPVCEGRFAAEAADVADQQLGCRDRSDFGLGEQRGSERGRELCELGLVAGGEQAERVRAAGKIAQQVEDQALERCRVAERACCAGAR